MSIQVYRSPDILTTREFPSVHDIYVEYLTAESVNANATTGNLSSNTLSHAVALNDGKAVEQLIALRATVDKFQITAEAVINNCPASLKVLLQQVSIKDTDYVNFFFLEALKIGREETFDELLKNECCENIFKNSIGSPKNATFVIQTTALGGNPALLEKMIKTYQLPTNHGISNERISQHILKNNGDGDAIMAAIKSGSAESVKLLISTVNKTFALSEELKLNYLLQAIKKNHPHIVSFLIDTIRPDSLNTITMSTSAVERTDLSILNDLQKSGFVFTEATRGIILTKEHQPVGFLLAIGIMLNKFTDFIKEVLSKTKSVTYNAEKFSAIKNSITHMKSEANVDTDNNPTDLKQPPGTSS